MCIMDVLLFVFSLVKLQEVLESTAFYVAYVRRWNHLLLEKGSTNAYFIVIRTLNFHVDCCNLAVDCVFWSKKNKKKTRTHIYVHWFVHNKSNFSLLLYPNACVKVNKLSKIESIWTLHFRKSLHTFNLINETEFWRVILYFCAVRYT